MTFEAKQFYRNLDELLHEIDIGKADRHWFGRLMEEIVERFGEELCIENGRLYREVVGGYQLQLETQSKDPAVKGLVIDPHYGPVELLQKNGVYIFDETVEGQSAEIENRLGGLRSVALLVEGAPRRILAFGLGSGWDRDRLDFAIKTIRNAIKHRLTLEDLKTDLDQAAEIQKSLLPQESPPFFGYSIAARSIAATQVGGDFYDFLPQEPYAMGIALGDASGHGLGAALLARDVVTGLRMGSAREFKLTSTVTLLNRVISRSMLSTRFVSLFYGELESNGNFVYVNAGHPPALLMGERGTRRLSIGGMILGPVKDAPFKRGFAHIDRGDTLVIVSDGFLERTAADDSEFGEKGLEDAVAPHVGKEAEVVLNSLFAQAEEFGKGRPWVDDITAVVVTRERGSTG